MSERSRRRAFLLGCNSSDLKYCESDARLMRDALQRRGFAVDDCITSTQITERCRQNDRDDSEAPVDYVQRRLRHFLEDDANWGDSVLVYFSGHSLYANGVFNLVVGADPNHSGSLLSVAAIAALFQQHEKPADRVLVLDCCEASAAAVEVKWEPKFAEWFQLWVAARTNEHTPEVDGSTRGGLFTAHILRALGEEANRIAEHGRLTLDAVAKFVREEIEAYGRSQAKPAPQPSLYGVDRQDVVLAEGLEPPPSPRAKGWPVVLIERLHHTVVQELGVDSRKAGASYEYCRARAASNILPFQPPDTPTETLLDALSVPRRYYLESNALKLPLVSFVTHLSRQSGAPEGLEEWLRDARHWAVEQGISEADVEAACRLVEMPANTEPRVYLMVLIAQDLNVSGAFSVSWHFIDEYGEPADQGDPIDGLTSRKALVAEVLNAARQLPGPLPVNPQVEVLLPFELLCDEGFIDALERAYYLTGERPGGNRLGFGDLADEFPLVLRSWERWFEPLRCNDRGGTNARVLWRERADDCLPGKPEPPCLHWLKPRAKQPCQDAALRNLRPQPPQPGALGIVCKHTLSPAQLSVLLNAGVPVLIWPRHRASTPTSTKMLHTNLGCGQPGQAFGDLPKALHRHRKSEIPRRSGKPPCEFSLLWEDPDRPIFDVSDHDTATMRVQARRESR